MLCVGGKRLDFFGLSAPVAVMLLRNVLGVLLLAFRMNVVVVLYCQGRIAFVGLGALAGGGSGFVVEGGGTEGVPGSSLTIVQVVIVLAVFRVDHSCVWHQPG